MRILYDPTPRKTEEIFSEQDRERFFGEFDVIEIEDERREAMYDAHLPETDVLISQQPMHHDRIDKAPKLRAIFNVETNFLSYIDYESCFQRGIHVLTPASVFASPVAEIGLGMALSLARDIHGAHSDFINRREKYGLEGNQRAELLTGSQVGFIGFGDLGRALCKLLQPFQVTTRVFDPWLPSSYLHRQGVEPATLKVVLRQSRVVFVVASVTSENQNLLDQEALAMMQDGAMLILLSRAALLDFHAITAEAQSGRLRFATDVFPEEPVQIEDSLRGVPNILFSAHRAGALASTLQQIGALVLEDLFQIAQNLPPVSCRRAERETIGKVRSKPIEFS